MRHPFLFIAFLAVSVSSQAETLLGRVVAVSDGDTLVLQTGGEQRKVRIANIDAPERVQPFGSRAQVNLGQLSFQKQATANCSGRGNDGLPRCMVVIEGRDVGLRQLADGMAWWLEEDVGVQAPEVAAVYRQAEMMAKLRRAGLWSETNPAPPRDWRKLTR